MLFTWILLIVKLWNCHMLNGNFGIPAKTLSTPPPPKKKSHTKAICITIVMSLKDFDFF